MSRTKLREPYVPSRIKTRLISANPFVRLGLDLARKSARTALTCCTCSTHRLSAVPCL
jgi:hypothetical protein